MDSINRKLFLVDAMALIYRAHFGLAKKTNLKAGTTHTGTVFGFANTLMEILEKERPKGVVVAMDSKEATFRKKLYQAYKADREAQPEAITKALPYIKQLLNGFNIPILTKKGYEADDLVGTLAIEAKRKGWTVYLMTTDKDFAQLVSSGIFWYKPGLGKSPSQLLDEKKVCERWGLQHPSQFVDLLGLWGDKADNIPGVKGIGEKRAQELLRSWGSIEKIYENLATIPLKIQEKLQQQEAAAMLSKRLATIQTDVPIDWDLKLLKTPTPDPNTLLPLFKKLGLKKLSHKIFPALSSTREKGGTGLPLFSLPQSCKEGNSSSQPSYPILKKPDQIQDLVRKIQKEKIFSIHTKTDLLDPDEPELVGLSISYQKKKAYYISLVDGELNPEQLIQILEPLLSSNRFLKIGHDLKYTIGLLAAAGITLSGPFFDTMIAHQLLQPDARHTLSSLASDYLGPDELSSIQSETEMTQQKKKSMVPLYACQEAISSLALYHLFEKELQKEGLSNIFYKIEMPLLPVLVHLEHTGVKIHEEQLKKTGDTIRKRLEDYGKKIHELAGCQFNINSPKQLGSVLFDKIGVIKNASKTKTGQYATGEAILNSLKKKHPIIPLLLSYREEKKLLSTYIDSLPTYISKKDGRIHTSYNQAVVSSGRLSSSRPNLQNIPIRTENGRAIRSIFIPEKKGDVLLSADYSQIELRLMAHFSKDPTLLDAFRRGEDVHTATAAKLFNCSIKEVTPPLRRKAKTVNFGIIYGISAYGLAQNLSITRKEAQQIIDTYFLEFPKIKTYREAMLAKAKKKGYCETVAGRRRYLPDIASQNSFVRGMAERVAVNMPLQGSAAEIIKKAMIALYERLQKKALDIKMILQVHDELVLELPEHKLPALQQEVVAIMEGVEKLSIPLKVDIGVGKNWLAAH